MKIRSIRILHAVLALLTVPVGMSTRIYKAQMPYLIGAYGGDILYATLIFFCIRFCLPRKKLATIALYAYLVCITIECLQLYHAPWIEAVRHTPPFGLIFGYGFLWSDWICYALGVLLAWAFAGTAEKRLQKRDGIDLKSRDQFKV